MNEYEITYLADPKLDEQDKVKLDENIDTNIADLKGNITYSSPTDTSASRRRLHYAIDKNRVAWLRTIQLELDPASIEKLRTTLKKTKGIIRTSILNTPRRQEVPATIFDSLNDKKGDVTKEKEPIKKSGKKVTDKEISEKIDEALEEEVK
jgi:ribosomal protein S6